MPAPSAVLELIERFERNLDAYRSGRYKETQVRLEFIDPLFKALGWDIYNEAGHAEAYKDVVHEDAIKVGGAHKAPDYSFRVGGTRKFFLEAKKPSIDLKDDPNPAYQLRRYAWSAKLPLSILTDFEELAVYDCRIRPVQTDKSSAARIMYLTFGEYPERWEELYGIFSREAVLKGDFDRYVESKKAKRGTAQVDDAFLGEIEAWRDELARNIALRNTDLTQREVNFAVGRTIDRIIFLRIGEDRGIEEYGRLMTLLNGTNVYRRLMEYYHRADERYNSGLFHFRKEKDRPMPPDELTLKLAVDDRPLKDIFKSLYYPDSPYEFSVLPADILGQVYEQFLGKVIRLTEGHRAKVEDKPEVKKAGGVYYTPTYIVDYIVKHTVGKLLEGPSGGRTGMTPRQAAKLRILDPACGSGSFLLGAYQLLLDWHRDWYVEELARKGTMPGKGTKPSKGAIPGKGTTRCAPTKNIPIYQVGEKEWRLTTAERKRILLNNIYGVDIDAQAVEVTKLSLLLKVLEGESAETINRQLQLLHERALPDLGSNIKCGNSLIGPDFYEGRQMDLPDKGRAFDRLDEEERYRINVFDWEAEFPEVFRTNRQDAGKKTNRQDAKACPERSRRDAKKEKDKSGFDAVIGNPPYGGLLTEKEVNYLERKFTLQQYSFDTYILFMEKALALLKIDSFFGMIIPNTWLLNLLSDKIRRHIFNKSQIINIVHHRRHVFTKATVDTQIVIIKNATPKIEHKVAISIVDKNSTFQHEIYQHDWQLRDGHPVNIFEQPEHHGIVERVKHLPRLDDLCKITQGTKPFQTGKGIPSQTRQIVKEKPFVSERRKDNTFRPLLRGSLIHKWKILWNYNYWISFGDWLAEPRYSASYDASEKIVIRQTGDSLIATIDTEQFVVRDNLYTIVSRSNQIKLRYVLGLLNSKLMNWYYQNILNPEQGEALAQVKRGHLARLPVRPVDFSNSTHKARHDKMVALVDRMLALHEQLAAARTEHEQTALQRQIDATDRQIDKLVYELYRLGEEEIGIVEG